MTMSDQTAARIKQAGIVAIIRGDFPIARLLQIGEALLAADLVALEVTLNSRDALAAIAELRARFTTGLLIGAGTVRTAEQVGQAIAAGAQFLVSPNFDAPSVARSQSADLLHLPGVFTPTEAHNAAAAGCRMLKLFPADVVGPAYLKALRAPLDDIDFVPTGGVSRENIGTYAQAGAAAVAVGSALISGPQQQPAEITARAEALRWAWEQARPA